MFNEVILIGQIASEPVIKSTSNGLKMANVVVQVERPYRNSLGIREIDYINCVLWKGMADTLIECCHVGSYIGLKGRIQSNRTDIENKPFLFEVKVEQVSYIEKYLHK